MNWITAHPELSLIIAIILILSTFAFMFVLFDSGKTPEASQLEGFKWNDNGIQHEEFYAGQYVFLTVDNQVLSCTEAEANAIANGDGTYTRIEK